MSQTITVVGATGMQGRAVTAHLLAAGWQVTALTRDPASPAAEALAGAGARVVGADMADPRSLDAAFDGAHGVFSVQPTVGSPGTPPDFTADDEVAWGVNVAEAADRAGVAHLVFSSVGGAERHETETLPKNLVSKWRIERRIAELGLPATILRPVSFMENYSGGYYLRDGALTTALAPDVAQQVLAVDDVGAFAAKAFAAPDAWIGHSLELAGDALTPVRVAELIGESLGIDLPYVNIPVAVLREFSEAGAVAHTWLNERGYGADIAGVRALHPGLLDFPTWLARTGRGLIAAHLSG